MIVVIIDSYIKIMSLDVTVSVAIAERRRKLAIYSSVSLVTIVLEIGLALFAAFMMANAMYDASTAATMLVTVVVTIDTSLRIRERAAAHHAAYIRLRHIQYRISREASGATTHPLLEEYEEIQMSAPVDLISGACGLCTSPIVVEKVVVHAPA